MKTVDDKLLGFIIKNTATVGSSRVSGYLALLLIVAVFTVSAHSQTYTLPCGTLNGTGGYSAECPVSPPIVSGVVDKLELTSTITSSPAVVPPVSVRVCITHVASGRTLCFPWAAKITTTGFNGLTCNTKWTIQLAYTPTNVVVTLKNCTLKVWCK
jgi:hypothetical protein